MKTAPAILGFLAVCLLTCPASAVADVDDSGGVSKAQNPSLINGLEIGAGSLTDFGRGSATTFYYSVKYKSTLIEQKGTPFPQANLNKPLPIATPEKPGGDTGSLVLDLNRGAAVISGGVLDALGVKSFRLPGALLRDIRGTARVAGRLDGKQWNFALGLESPPLHPLDFANRKGAGITNWLIFGLAGQNEQRSQSIGDDQTVGMATYRTFVGRGLGWRRSPRYQDAVEKLRTEVKKKAPTGQQAKTFFEEHKTQGQLSLSSYVDEIVYWLGQREATQSAKDWQARVNDAVENGQRAAYDQPTYAIWLEDAGWYTFTAVSDEKHYNNMLAIRVMWWPAPESHDQFELSLSYENGRDRAAPTVSKNQLIAALGMRF